MIIDGNKFTETRDSNTNVVTFSRPNLNNLKIIIDSFTENEIHTISFDDGVDRRMYVNPITFTKKDDAYCISYMLTEATEKDIESSKFKEVQPLVRDILQTASADVVKKYVSFLDQWKAGEKYKKGQRIGYNSTPYTVESDHTAQDGQTPDKTPLMYESLLNPRKAEPWDEKKTYNKGDLAIARGIVFVSKIDGNKGNEPGFGNAWDYKK
nr:MAG TPA: ChiA1-BD-binding domain protein [Caudoviricetes sp.]